jgi:apolipoprotein N-acyltransferase
LSVLPFGIENINSMQTQTHDTPPNQSKLWQQSLELFLILTTVSLFYLAFPTGGYSNLAWFALIPVFIALKNKNLRQAFFIGFLAATLGWIISVWWVVPGLSNITSSSPNLIVPFVLLYCCLSALPYAFGCWLHVYLNGGKNIFSALLSALIFTILVNYSPQILPGNLAHALYDKPVFIQTADIGGVPLVFFIMHSVCFLLAKAITIDKEHNKQRVACLLLAITVFCANYSYGYYKINQSNNANVEGSKQINVAIVQPNISIENRTRDDWQRLAPELMEMVNDIVKTEKIDLIVLPELPVPVSFQYFEFDKKLFNQLESQTNLILTAIKPIGNELDNNKGYFNTMELVSNNQLVQSYAKQVLLPFGEYLPFEDTLPWLRTIFPHAPNYKQGNENTLFLLPFEQHSIKVVPLICYEAVFSETVAQGIKQGGELLINTSNDAWFGDSAGQSVHLALSTFRSVEYRKILVRNTNNGISVIIDPFGRQIESSKITPHSRGYSVTSLNILARDSFYQQYPNLIKWLIYALTAFGIIVTIIKKQAIK